MNLFTLDNPVFRVYVIAAGLAILKMIAHAFLTVYRMLKAKGGFLNLEDTRRTLSNPDPSPAQLAPHDDVERARRMHRNEGENTALFLGAGLLFVSAAPPPWDVAQVETVGNSVVGKRNEAVLIDRVPETELGGDAIVEPVKHRESIAPFGRGREPEQFFRFELRQQPLIRRRSCVVKLVDDHDIEVFRINRVQPIRIE